MKTKKFAFVILHYMTLEDTNRCIESINSKCKKYNYDIIVVDNHSLNNSGSILRDLYKNDKKIHIIQNQQNLGFAKGNNIGFKYAKNVLKADYIILCNNDTYLIQSNFIQLIEEEYNDSHFDVLGPKIILKNNKINPVNVDLPSIKKFRKNIRNLRISYVTSLIYMYKPYLFFRKMIKDILIKLKIKSKDISITSNYDKRYENPVLHGCFLIFSKKYIDLFDGLDERTFLYMEEELLAIRLKQNNLKSIYSPKLIICHNEDGATNAIMKNNRKKNIFIFKNMLKSSKIILAELEGLSKDSRRRYL